MLSSQTKDEISDAAISKLRVALGGSTSIDGIICADESSISQAIDRVGFWRRKTGYLNTVGKVSTDESVQIFSRYRVVLSICGTDAF